MFFLPVGHSSSTVRRQPWVSYTIIALNILIFFFFTHGFDYDQAERYAEEIAEHLKKHPQVVIDPALRDLLTDHFLEEYDEARGRSQAVTEKLRDKGLSGGSAHLERLTGNLQDSYLSEAQDEMDQLTEKILAIFQGGSSHRWGYIPAREGHYHTLVTTLFFHGGLMHLLGNMFMFYLCGPFVEDRWGRVLFTLAYLASGIVATLCHGFLTPSPEIPLIGASGAIAGMMGAFLILFFHTKIKFLYFFFFAFRFFKGTFEVPSYVVLPLWFAQQYYNAMTLSHSPIAFWAHVGGFACGFVVASIIKLSKVEERYISEKIERQITFYEAPPLLEDATQKWSQGEPQEAIEILNRLLKETPNDTNVLYTLFEVYCSLEDAKAIQKFGSRLIDDFIRQNQLNQAKDTYKNMKINHNQVYPVAKTLFNMAAAFEGARETNNANKAYEKITVQDKKSE